MMTFQILIYVTLMRNKLNTVRFSCLDSQLNTSDIIENSTTQLTVEVYEA